MKLLYKILLVSICLCTLACKDSTKTTTDPAPPQEKIVKASKQDQLLVEVDKLRLRDQADETGKVLTLLKKGESLTDLGEVSISMQTIKIRGVKYTEPWMKVRTASGQEGWVFGGAVNFEGLSFSKAALKMQERKLKTIFGNELAQRVLNYKVDFKGANSAEKMADLYKNGTILRDTLVEYLTNRITYENEDVSPDLFWLNKMLPGFIVQLAAEGTVYYFYWDYKQLAAKAKETKGNKDDKFIELCLKVNEVDSIESFFPSWFLQTWDYGGNSLLGRGTHKKVLSYMDEIYTPEHIFAKEITAFKENLINDITNKDVEYWEGQSKILAELDEIIKADFKILNRQDKISLTTRRSMFAEYKKNKINLNVRSGT